MGKEKLEIFNTKSSIPKSIEENIFQPFISSNGEEGHGLGLYIVEYYGKTIGYEIEVKNIEKGVVSIVNFK